MFGHSTVAWYQVYHTPCTKKYFCIYLHSEYNLTLNWCLVLTSSPGYHWQGPTLDATQQQPHFSIERRDLVIGTNPIGLIDNHASSILQSAKLAELFRISMQVMSRMVKQKWIIKRNKSVISYNYKYQLYLLLIANNYILNFSVPGPKHRTSPAFTSKFSIVK